MKFKLAIAIPATCAFLMAGAVAQADTGQRSFDYGPVGKVGFETGPIGKRGFEVGPIGKRGFEVGPIGKK